MRRRSHDGDDDVGSGADVDAWSCDHAQPVPPWRGSAAEERATLRRQRATTRTSRDSSIFGADQLDAIQMQLVLEMANQTEIGRETRAVALCAAIPVGGMSPSYRGSITAPGASQRAAKPWCRKDSRATGILVEEARRRWDHV